MLTKDLCKQPKGPKNLIQLTTLVKGDTHGKNTKSYKRGNPFSSISQGSKILELINHSSKNGWSKNAKTTLRCSKKCQISLAK